MPQYIPVTDVLNNLPLIAVACEVCATPENVRPANYLLNDVPMCKECYAAAQLPETQTVELKD